VEAMDAIRQLEKRGKWVKIMFESDDERGRKWSWYATTHDCDSADLKRDFAAAVLALKEKLASKETT
jgi:hypothetical protein